MVKAYVFENGESAAKLRTGEGSTIIPKGSSPVFLSALREAKAGRSGVPRYS